LLSVCARANGEIVSASVNASAIDRNVLLFIVRTPSIVG
jgi:hypothetical protein